MIAAPRPRLFVADVDGTLVRHDKSLADATVEAFARLRAAGIAASLISARPPSGMVRLAAALGLTGPIAAFNGGTIVDADGTIQSSIHLAPATAASAVALLDEAGLEIWLFADGQWFTRHADHPRVPRERLSAGIEPTVVTDFSGLTARVDKIVGIGEDEAVLLDLQRRAREAFVGMATVAMSQSYYLDFSATLANKGDGITALAAAYGVPLTEVAAIGDMANDLPMFALAGASIAMGQSPPAVRDAARFVTTSNIDDGVAHAIDTIMLADRSG